MLIYYTYLREIGSFVGHSVIFKSLPLFPHGLKGVFIAGGAHIGTNCVIFQQVTIGANPLPASKTCGLPWIGSNVYIGAGAKIIGNIRVGDNCRIGANCTVFEDIPDNCVVVSQPPRIIQKENLDNRFYRWSAEGPLYYENGNWNLETDPDIIRMLNGKL